MALSALSILKIMFFISYVISLALDPFRQVSADLSKANEILALIHRIIFAFLYVYKLC